MQRGGDGNASLETTSMGECSIGEGMTIRVPGPEMPADEAPKCPCGLVTLRSLETSAFRVCVGVQVRKWRKGPKAAAEMLAGFRPEGSGEGDISRRVNLGSWR